MIIFDSFFFKKFLHGLKQQKKSPAGSRQTGWRDLYYATRIRL